MRGAKQMMGGFTLGILVGLALAVVVVVLVSAN